jgi:aminopeptidase
MLPEPDGYHRRRMDAEMLDRYAELIVNFAANVQPGQMVDVSSELGKENLTRAVAAACYRAGAHHVFVHYVDMHVKRAKILEAPEAALGFAPEWTRQMVRELGEKRGASIYLDGVTEPGILDGLDAGRLGRDRTPATLDWLEATARREINWTIVPAPTPAWAGLAYPELAPADRLDRLWDDVMHVCRMNEADPVAAWRARAAELDAVAERLTGLRLDALHFAGPGTDLQVGLLPTSSWIGGADLTVGGIVHMANLPTEEVFTAPDPERTRGSVRSTRPLDLSGTTVRDLEVRFEAGRAVDVRAGEGAEALRAHLERDEGAPRLGEVALVDRAGRIAALDRIFYDVLLDENASSHIALGSAYDTAVGEDDRERINRSEVHVDFMIGGDDVTVTGVTTAGERVPLLVGGEWL